MRLLALIGVVVVPVVSVGYFTSTSGFYWDDLINFREAQLRGLSLSYVLEPTSAHLAPGHRFGDWVIQEFFPMNFRVAQGLMLAGLAATLVAFHRLVAQLFGPGPGPLLLTLVFGASTVHVGTLNWWASGLDRLPATFLTFVSLLGYLRFFRTGSRRSLALSVVAMAVALLFYIKPAFVPLYLLLMRVLLLQPGQPIRDSVAAAAREWRVWLLYLVPVGIFGLIYVRGYSTAQDPSLSLLTRYLSHSWFQVVTPGFFGVYIPKETAPALAITVSVALQAVLVVLVVWSGRRVAGAWRAWVFFALTFLVNAAVVGLTRVGAFGPKDIAYLLYYNLEAAYLFCITLGAVLLSVRGDGLRRPTMSLPEGWLRRRGRAALVVAMAVYLAFGWWGAHRLRQEHFWFGEPSRQYMEAVDDNLRTARAGRQRLVLVNGTVPYEVVHEKYNSHSEILPLLDDDLSFDSDLGELFEVGDDATVKPVAFMSEAGGQAAGLLQDGSLAVVPADRSTLTESGLCVTAGDEATTVMAYRIAGPLVDDDWYLRLDLTSNASGVVGLLSEREDGTRSPQPPRLVHLHDRPERVRHVFPLETTSVQRLFLVLNPGTDICVGTLEVGRLLPR